MRSALRSALASLVVALVLSGCPSLGNFYRGRDAVGATVDVGYRSDGLEKHRLDVYHPRETREPWPVVVFVHGGYWKGGDKTYWQAITGLYGNAGVALGELGVGAVVTNYRLYPDATLDDMLDDVVGAMVWTHEHIAELGGDPNRIYIAGHSAGGHLVTLLGSRPELLRKRGFDPAWLNGVVGISGIYDIPSTVPLVDPELQPVFTTLFGTEASTQRDASPLFHFNKDMPPTYLIAGENDYKSVRRDFQAAQEQLKPLLGDKVFFKLVPYNTHEEMVLKMGTPHDEVGPAIAAFVMSTSKRRP